MVEALKILDSDRLLDMDQAADLLNVKKSTLYAMTMRHEIPFVKFNRLNRFRRGDLNKWVEAHIVGAN